MATHQLSLVQLAERMLECARKIEGNISQPPTFLHDTIPELPKELADTRLEAIALSDEFNDLVRGSRGFEARWWKTLGPCPQLHAITWHFIWRFKVPQAVPLESSISYAELAFKCGVNEGDLVQILRSAIAMHLFSEPEPGFVAHTQETRLLVEIPSCWDIVGYCSEQVWPAATKAVDAMVKWPGSQEPTQAGYNVNFDTEKPFYLHMMEVPDWQRRFGSAMQEFSIGDAEATAQIALTYPWEEVESTVVDLGGSTGQVSQLIASRYTHLSFTVQDLPGATESAAAANTQERVTYMAHDFFSPQLVQADAYLICRVLHNQTDKNAIAILRALIPALKAGAKILWCDRDILPPTPGGTRDFATSQRNKTTIAMDITMKLLMNGKQRTVEEKAALFTEADPRLVFGRNFREPGTAFGIVEGVWDG